MKLKQNEKGFTLAELLAVVAILTILGGLVFLAVQNNLTSMTRLEYDNAAKELFVVAQNHLTLAHSQGYYGLTEADAGNPEDGEDQLYYIIKNGEYILHNKNISNYIVSSGNILRELFYYS
jgi:prepilin-type N-terminal cleavage/methylation domain-containing protein